MESIRNLAGGLAHDFNNILGGISGALSILDHKLNKSNQKLYSELKKYIDLISKAASRASDITRQLLTLSRKQELSMQPVDLNDCIRDITDICMNSFPKSIIINSEYYKKTAQTWADSSHIEQVLLNLCINASHAMTIMREDDTEKGGNLNISLANIKTDCHFKQENPEAVEDEYWEISVGDNGVGMDRDAILKIFDPFFTTKKTGTGLGMAMVYNIIKQHSGFVKVYSEKRSGTTVKIYLPVYKKISGKDTESAENKKIYYSSGLIMIIDNEIMMRQITGEILKECGYTVILYGNSQDAVNKFRERNDEIDLVILDLIIQGSKAENTITELKKIKDNCRIILTSGQPYNDKIESIMMHGADRFIQKPFSLYSLGKIVYEVLNMK